MTGDRPLENGKEGKHKGLHFGVFHSKHLMQVDAGPAFVLSTGLRGGPKRKYNHFL